MAEKYAPSCHTQTGILDLPVELLNQIILLLTPRERGPLGRSCHRFKALIFEDPVLLRHLDFSKKAGVTTMTDIQQYFNDENACQHIRRVNVSNVDCMQPGDPLSNTIGKAFNLVELNIRGVQFKDISELGSFLNGLRHLEKLSINWPESAGADASLRQTLQPPFCRLTYLSVRIETFISTMFTSYLSLCPHLEELCAEALHKYDPGIRRAHWNSEVKQLRNLKIVQYHGYGALKIKEELVALLLDPKRWTDFQLCGANSENPLGFYIEKDIEVCEELLQSKRLQEFLSTAPWENFKLKWALNPEYLLTEVLRITHQNVPEDWCCLSRFVGGLRHLLKVDEAKRLLKDPRYQISFLYLNHKLEGCCDAHLLASAFPNLSELVLHAVSLNLEDSPKNLHFQRRLSWRCSSVPEKQDDSPNLDSSFKILVENTPNLRHFTLHPVYWTQVEDWDWGGLSLISGWQNLETLDLPGIHYEDDQFLIEIGKHCKNLKKLHLRNYWFPKARFGRTALFQMLRCCRNLRDLTIECNDVDLAEMFALLAENTELERVEASNVIIKHSAASWISSLESMIRQCAKLTTIICNTTFKTKNDFNTAVSAVKRIKRECRRPDFQIRAMCQIVKKQAWHEVIGVVVKDSPQNEPFGEIDW